MKCNYIYDNIASYLPFPKIFYNDFLYATLEVKILFVYKIEH